MSCLFNSLSYFLDLHNNEIRQKICDYLEENKPIMDGIETKSILEMEGQGGFHSYIANMRRTHTWGGAIEIQVACNIWSAKIFVKCLRGKDNSIIEFLPISGQIKRDFSLEWTGGHYEPVR